MTNSKLERGGKERERKAFSAKKSGVERPLVEISFNQTLKNHQNKAVKFQ